MGSVSSYIKRLGHTEALTLLGPVVYVYRTACPITGPIPSFIHNGDELQGIFDDFKSANDAAQSGATLDKHLRNELRPPFNTAFINFIDFVELASRHDPTLPYKFKLDSVLKGKTVKPSSRTGKKQVPDFSVAMLGAGSLSARFHGGARKGIEVQINYGNPANEEEWVHLDNFPTCKIELRNLNSGKRCSIRAREIGEDSPWSHYVSVMIP